MIERRPELADQLLGRSDELARETARLHLDRYPQIAARFPGAEARCAEDGVFHVQHLAAAVSMGRPELFDEYAAWTADLLAGFGIEGDERGRHLRTLAEVVRADLGEDAGGIISQTIEDSLATLPEGPADQRSLLIGSRHHAELARRILDALLGADRHLANDLVIQAADAGTPIQELYLDVFQPCLYEVGWLWQTGKASVAQEHFVSAAVQLAMAQLYPRLFTTPRISRSVIVASAGGELHEIGGRMVADIFELHGWDSHFTGANTASQDVAALVVERGADAVAISATLPSHLPMVEQMVRAIRETGEVPILVGGRPFNQAPDLWQVVAADATATDAVAAVHTAAALVDAA